MNATYLVHHGVKNQRWGERNGPPYPLTDEARRDAGYIKSRAKHARKMQKKLNRIEDQQTMNDAAKKEVGAYKEYAEKTAESLKDQRGLINLIKRSSNKRWLKVLNQRLDELDRSDAKLAKDRSNIIKKLNDDGFETQMELSIKTVDSEFAERSFQVLGLTATVKDKNYPENNGDSGKPTKEKIQEKIAKAEKEDEYDLDFLEAVQNDPVLRRGGKDLVNEYKRYLKDPDYYWDHRDEGSEFVRAAMKKPKIKAVFEKSRKIGYKNLSDEEKEIIDTYSD